MSSVNKVILIGNLGKDPEVRHLEGGTAVARVTLATSEKFKDKNGTQQEKTEWHNITFWRGLAEVVEKYVKKGDKIFVEGKIETRKYTDKDGVERYATEIVAKEMTMLGGKSEGATQSQGQQKAAVAGGFAPGGGDDDNDLPF